MSQPVIASLRAIRKRFGGIVALDGVDLDLHAGEVLAVLGANGAGKTTAVSCLLGLVNPDEGEVSLFGQLPRKIEARRQIGAMLQVSGVPETLRVRELLALFASYYADPRELTEIAGAVGIDTLLDRRYGKLSGGQQRRVQFGLALIGRPKALFLDEPTVGLDIEARQAFWSVIRDQVAAGCAVLLTTHYLEEAEALADRVIVLARGRVIADGSVDSLRAHSGQRSIVGRTQIDATRLAGWAGVVAVENLADGRIRLKTNDAEQVLRQWLTEDENLTELEVKRAGLAETFIELTREAA